MDSTLDSFTDVIRQHQASVYAVAYGVTGDRALAEDVVQETFVVAWRDRSALREPAKLPQWLRGIARNLAKQAAAKAGPIAEAAGEVASSDPRAESISDEEARITWAALGELPETCPVCRRSTVGRPFCDRDGTLTGAAPFSIGRARERSDDRHAVRELTARPVTGAGPIPWQTSRVAESTLCQLWDL